MTEPQIQENARVHCDSCERTLQPGEVYWESLVARRVVGEPPPIYAGKTFVCDLCEKRDGRCEECLSPPGARHYCDRQGFVEVA